INSFSQEPALGDFDGDGKLDIAVVDQNANMVNVLLGNNDGSFGAHVSTPVGSVPIAVAAGHFDGDRHLDLAVTVIGMAPASTVSVLLGNGDGSFRSAPDISVAGSPGNIIAADLDGDHEVDLAVSNQGTVDVILGNGDGTFRAPEVFPG